MRFISCLALLICADVSAFELFFSGNVRSPSTFEIRRNGLKGINGHLSLFQSLATSRLSPHYLSSLRKRRCSRFIKPVAHLEALGSTDVLQHYLTTLQSMSPFGVAACTSVGLILGLLGGGGSILAVPVFMFIFEESPKAAIAEALAVVAVAATIGCMSHIANRNVDFQIAIPFGICASIGSYLGATFASSVDAKMQLGFFIAFAVTSSGMMMNSALKELDASSKQISSGTGSSSQPNTNGSFLHSASATRHSFFTDSASAAGAITSFSTNAAAVSIPAVRCEGADHVAERAIMATPTAEQPIIAIPSLEQTMMAIASPEQPIIPTPSPEHKPAFTPLLGAQAVLVGTMTSLVGAGGGFIIVPALTLIARLPVKSAVGSSLLITATNALSGFCGYLSAAAAAAASAGPDAAAVADAAATVAAVHVDGPLVAAVATLAGGGALAGTAAGRAVSQGTVKLLFSGTVLAITAGTVLKAAYQAAAAAAT